MIIYSLQKTQIATLKQNEAPIKVPAKHSDFSNILSEKKTLMLPKHTELNEYAIQLEKS